MDFFNRIVFWLILTLDFQMFIGITPTILGMIPYAGLAFTINEQGKKMVSLFYKQLNVFGIHS